MPRLRSQRFFDSGTLSSSGSLIVGPLGSIVGPVLGLKVVHCSGRMMGDISADKLVVTGSGFVDGTVCSVFCLSVV
jgi:cytoskeletal protein CcmA (bactofilin family)